MDLSDNKITGPASFLENMRSLKKSNLSKNKISELPAGCKWMNKLEELDVGSNQLKYVFSLNLSTNSEANSLPSYERNNNQNHEFVAPSLTSINAQNNQLLSVFDGCESVFNIRHSELYVKRNENAFPSLSTLILANNLIKCLVSSDINNPIETSISVLDVSGNKIEIIEPELVRGFIKLTRLNISSNKIKNIPNEIGFIESLVSVELEGNPLRFRPVGQTPGQVCAYFKKLAQSETLLLTSTNALTLKFGEKSTKFDASKFDEESENSNQIDFSKYYKNGLLDLDSFGFIGELFGLSESDIQDLFYKLEEKYPESEIKKMKLSSNNLDKLPINLLSVVSNTLVTLDLSHNKLRNLDSIFKDTGKKKLIFPKLTDLNMSFNMITSFYDISSHNEATHSEEYKDILGLHFPRLSELNLNFNGISEFVGSSSFDENTSGGQVITLRKFLGTEELAILHLSKNKIVSLEDPRFLDGLVTIDLSDNEIGSVPYQLGMISSIKSLNLNGNRFRVPRRQTLELGTDAVMAWLRDRIAT
ncbi:hypothetical protein BB559_003219 [Furculomyces boomerangus]|uniref:Uncharacterized protein n=1 Tax=Furculomyces boomerangus TaxID=61424 RepID=A0A2T9YMP6_9FUNG|nr:hypothetical protein BB559_003219 [Furculomyces boomerangus]